VRTLLARLAEDALGALSQFRSGQARLGAGLLPAFLPACLVEPYFKSMLAPRRDALVEVADISPLTRVVRMWFAHWRRRI
jgi:phytoene synthase